MTWTMLHSRLHTTLKQRKLLDKGSRLLIAVSGGQDSLCLLKLLFDLQEKWQYKIVIAHCDHRWSSDVGMANHVQKIAENWGIDFHLKIAPNMKETEANARVWRYQALTEIATKSDLQNIITGHTKSDRAETLLYNLIRGAGSDGLQALTWKRSLTDKINLVRPLLNFSRQETGDFCQQFQLPVWEDIANQKLHYARNRIRTQLLPYIKTHFNPEVETALAQTAELLQAEVEFLETMAKKILKQAINLDQTQLNRLLLRDIPLALQRRVIRQFLKNILQKDPNFEQIESLVSLLNAPNGSRTSSLSGKISLEVRGNWLVISQ